MTNYTNVNNTLPGIETTIGTGFNNLFGEPAIIGLIGLIVIVILGYTLHLDLDTQILSGITMVFILLETVNIPEWVFFLTLVPIGIYAGVIFSRIIHK